MATTCVAIAACVLMPVTQTAQAGPIQISSPGPRVGLRFSPDQLVLGGHASMWESATGFRATATATLGFGDNATVLDVVPEIHYMAETTPIAPRSVFYVGAGPDLALIFPDKGSNDSDLGITLLGGIEHRLLTGGALFGEFRLQFHNSDEWFEIHAGFRMN